MKLSIDRLRSVSIGHGLDNGTGAVQIDCSAWLKRLPMLVDYAIAVTRPDGEIYFAPASIHDGELEWIITAADTAVPGEGMYQVIATGAGGERRATDYFSLFVHPNMPGLEDASETPPDPARGWVDEVLEAAGSAAQSAADAKAQADRAQELVDGFQPEGGGEGAVKSVNGKTGEVTLTAKDVKALPEDTEIPPAYSLPTASAGVKGGVKVGGGLSMDGETLEAEVKSEDIDRLTEEIANKGNPTDDQVNAAVNAYLSKNPILTEYVTPEMFGAAGDGSANDDTAIQEALNHGGLVIFPGTQYKIGTNITIPSNTYLLGYGARITPYNYKGKLITSSSEGSENIHVDGLIFDGYITTQYGRDPAHGLHFNGVTNCTVENCVFADNNDGVYIAYSANQRNDVRIRNCRFTNFMRQGITLIHGEALIEGCTFTRNEEKGINAIDLEPNNTYEIPKATVRNCTLTNCSIYANRKALAANHGFENLELTVENCDITSGTRIGCVDVSFAERAHIKNCKLNDVSARRETIYNACVVFYRVNHASIENCVITSGSSSAISGSSSRVYVNDCNISAEHVGIVSIGKRCDVLNTHVQAGDNWALVYQNALTEGVVSNCNFGNAVSVGFGSSENVYPENVRFAFNTIANDAESAIEYGLRICADNSTFAYNRITGFTNDIDDATYSGTGNIFEHNVSDVVKPATQSTI